MGIFEKLKEGDVNTNYYDVLIDRIIENKEQLMKKVDRGKKKEDTYYNKNKKYVEEA